MPSRGATMSQKTPALDPEELSKALNVKPPSDPQALEDHVHQLLMRAQVSWLSKRDVLDILSNWQAYNLPISLMPPDQPGPGSLFLFDRNQLKSFRRDNHVWKSKAGGKTVQETHEKLKIDGGIPALNCYYAHSADGLLQRRCYWKLADTPNIVLMHYRAPTSGTRDENSSPPPAATSLTVHARGASGSYLPDATIDAPAAAQLEQHGDGVALTPMPHTVHHPGEHADMQHGAPAHDVAAAAAGTHGQAVPGMNGMSLVPGVDPLPGTSWDTSTGGPQPSWYQGTNAMMGYQAPGVWPPVPAQGVADRGYAATGHTPHMTQVPPPAAGAAPPVPAPDSSPNAVALLAAQAGGSNDYGEAAQGLLSLQHEPRGPPQEHASGMVPPPPVQDSAQEAKVGDPAVFDEGTEFKGVRKRALEDGEQDASGVDKKSRTVDDAAS